MGILEVESVQQEINFVSTEVQRRKVMHMLPFDRSAFAIREMVSYCRILDILVELLFD